MEGGRIFAYYPGKPSHTAMASASVGVDAPNPGEKGTKALITTLQIGGYAASMGRRDRAAFLRMRPDADAIDPKTPECSV